MDSPKDASGSDKSLIDGTFWMELNDLDAGTKASSLSSIDSCFNTTIALYSGSSH